MKLIWVLVFLFILTEVILEWSLRGAGWGVGNGGVSFGGLKGVPIWLIVVVLILFWNVAKQNRHEYGWRLVLLGGVTNLVARVSMGGVVWDYLPFFGLWFNACDIMISAGVLFSIKEQLIKKND